ncbi:MAG: glycerol-3-phosphate dehydrogenase/oxidase [Spirochaetales bacterium]|nr:glycerol-3-phosphate dehydrogenase/oxidase [Spirochaetales bacterium]
MHRFLENQPDPIYDVLIIGGGISGACVAYEAASRGLSVALVEKDDFGAATSAATSRLIHGGLRYLNYLEFGLVRESLRERRILEDIAPNFVYPLPFLIPTYRSLSSNRFILKAGMILYDMLSWDKTFTRHRSKKIPGHRSLSAKEVLSISPQVPAHNLTGGQMYFDCQSIFPERLTLAFLKSAAQYGAHLSNYARVVGFGRHSDGSLQTAQVIDQLTGQPFEIKAKIFINSAGPWVTRVQKVATGSVERPIRMSEGIHIIVPSLQKDHALVMQTPDRRHFFLIPWRGHTLIGTTDRDYDGDPDDYTVRRSSIEQFIGEINATFGKELIRYQDIRFAYGGLRPLTDTHTKSSYSSSRRYEIFDGEKSGIKGLITVEGGKYTTSRNLAESVVNLIEKKLGGKLRPSHTVLEQLYGAEMFHLEDFLQFAPRRYPAFAARTVQTLARTYGTEFEHVLLLATDEGLSRSLNQDGEILAQVLYAVRNEMARNLLDVLLRRTGLGSLGHPGTKILEQTGKIMARELRWSSRFLQSQLRKADEALRVPQ